MALCLRGSLLCKHKDLSLGPSTLTQNLYVYICSTSTAGTEAGGSLELSVRLSSARDPASKKEEQSNTAGYLT